MSLQKPNVAFVTGANGISGYAIIEYLVKQPEDQWSEIVISSRNSLVVPFLDHRVRFVATDFLSDFDAVKRNLEPYIGSVTHAFFTSYAHIDDYSRLSERNVPLFNNFLRAVDTLCPKLQRISLQTGGKNYGGHLQEPLMYPARESQPRFHDPTNFYFEQEDAMRALQLRRQTWTWNVIMPNGIIGATPHGSGISEVLSLAVFFLIQREVGEVAAWPWSEFMWSAPDDKSFAPGLGHFTVWTARQRQCANEAFNYVNGDVFVWKFLWPQLAEYFRVEAPSPDFSSRTVPNDMAEWAKDKEAVWERIVSKYGGNANAFRWCSWKYLDWAFGRTWYSMSSMNKARAYGWTRTEDSWHTYFKAIRSLENAGILPQKLASNVLESV